MGNVSDVKSTELKQNLFDAIKNYGHAISPKDLEELTGLRPHYIRKTLPSLVKEGSIKKVGRGSYLYVGNNGYNGNNGNNGYNGNNDIDVPVTPGIVPIGTNVGNNSKANINSNLSSNVPNVPIVPGDCENCDACDKEAMQCHYTSYFFGKASSGIACQVARVGIRHRKQI